MQAVWSTPRQRGCASYLSCEGFRTAWPMDMDAALGSVWGCTPISSRGHPHTTPGHETNARVTKRCLPRISLGRRWSHSSREGIASGNAPETAAKCCLDAVSSSPQGALCPATRVQYRRETESSLTMRAVPARRALGMRMRGPRSLSSVHSDHRPQSFSLWTGHGRELSLTPTTDLRKTKDTFTQLLRSRFEQQIQASSS
jgi:hypothetical protein